MWREEQAHQELPRIRISMGMLPWGFPARIWASLSLQRPHLSCGLGQGPCVAASHFPILSDQDRQPFCYPP